MKKMITTDDFMQLSEEQRGLLRDITDFYKIDHGFNWYNKILRSNDLQSSQYMIFNRKKKNVKLDTGEVLKVYPCFTIGDMEEILEDAFKNISFIQRDSYSKININFQRSYKHGLLIIAYKKGYKCDALWDCVMWGYEEGLI